MRRNPIYVTWEQIAQAGSGSPFARKYAELRMIAISHIGEADGQLSDPVDPGVFLRWAQRYKKEVPPELLAAVQEYGCNVRDWQDAYIQKEAEIEKWKGAYNVLDGRIKAQAQKIEELEGQLRPPAPAAADNEAEATGPWPWGTYETEDLRIMASAIKRYWVEYDPQLPGTAATIPMVQEWLVKTYGVASTKAAAMASIIKYEKLRSGRRSSK